jgi:tetratricopeptide (TPR) repeat protein
MAAVGLFVAVAAAHGGAIRGDFHYDDKAAIKDNLAVRRWLPAFYLTSPHATSAESGTAGYRPLTVASFALNYAVGGDDPSGYLFGNLLLHFAAAWLIFVVGRRLLQDDRWAGVAALVYAVHPVTSEAVNYAVARSSLLAVCGALLACWAFLCRQAGGTRWWTMAGLAAFLAALLSKESAVALLAPLAAYPLLMRTDSRAARWRSGLSVVAPYLVVFFAYFAVWWTVAGTHMEQRVRAAAHPAWAFVETVGRSLLLWVWPHPLGLDHPLVFATRFDAVTAGWLAGAGVAVLVVFVACWRRRPLVSWCLLWALAGFAPLATLPWMTTRGLLQENRITFSAAALAWLSAIALREVGAVWRRAAPGFRSTLIRRAIPAMAWAAAGTAIVVAVVLDRSRSAVWADDVRLWQEVLGRSPEHPTASVNLGAAYIARKDYDRAQEMLRRAAALAPGDLLPYYVLGTMEIRRERYDAAREWFLEAARRAPNSPRVLRMLGLTAIQQNRYDEAAVLLRRAATLNPRDATALAGLGLVEQQAGDVATAVGLYTAALDLDPEQPMARSNLGTVYLKQRRWSEALEQFAALLDRSPDDHDAALKSALALSALGRKTEAKAALNALLARLPPEPGSEAVRQNATFMLSQMTP